MSDKKDEKQTSHEYSAFGMPVIVNREKLDGLSGVLTAERFRRARLEERFYKRMYPPKKDE